MDPAERMRFEEATLPHVDAAYNLARWLTQNDHAAEDVVQEAFLRAARYFDGFRGGDGRPWLLGVVRRASFDWLAKHRAKSTVATDENIHDRGDESSNPEHLAIREVDQAGVREAARRTADGVTKMVVLRDIEGCSYRVIATVTELPIGTVMSRLSRGREKLRQRLAPPPEGEA